MKTRTGLDLGQHRGFINGWKTEGAEARESKEDAREEDATSE